MKHVSKAFFKSVLLEQRMFNFIMFLHSHKIVSAINRKTFIWCLKKQLSVQIVHPIRENFLEQNPSIYTIEKYNGIFDTAVSGYLPNIPVLRI